LLVAAISDNITDQTLRSSKLFLLFV